MLALLATVTTSLLAVDPAPLEMPRAQAYLVRENGRMRLEDRYATDELWLTQTVAGRWIDDDFRIFTTAELAALPPAVAGAATRVGFADARVAAKRKEKDHVFRMVSALAPVEPTPEYAPPRQLPHGYRDVRYYQGTNESAIVCAYLAEGARTWRYAAWELAEGDDFAEKLGVFEDELFFSGDRKRHEAKPDAGGRSLTKDVAEGLVRERELLRADAAHSVAAYPSWHFTPSEEFVILDDLKWGRDFVTSLTNELPRLRARAASTLPTPLDGSNVLAVARIFRNRADFELAAGPEMAWSAAYWNPSRRELVACLPPDGDLAELRRTFRHEAFHQYLSYATSMIPVSPWLNEGYAQYFEDEDAAGLDAAEEIAAEQWDDLEQSVPGVMMMDYREFYDGSDAERRGKYRLAKSLAVFLERGAPHVRFEPFKDVKRDYIAALLRTHDMREATLAAFGSLDRLRQFANEWKKYYKNGGL